mmetsp:Transcript_9095/g.27234  ORF Transcript_9095/g.27234 Transcript_9095/m.27234 type:complete len:80 (-) Transcript_9095:593-832(-)
MRMVLLPLLVLAATSTLGHAAFPASGHRFTRSLTSVAFEKANVLRQKQRELANLGFFGGRRLLQDVHALHRGRPSKCAV